MIVITQRQAVGLKRLIKPVGWMLLVFYLGYHALHGERGIYALLRDKRELLVLEKELEETRQERVRLERRVSLLRDQSLDRDLLDEQMRRMLGVMKKGELVILGG